MDFSAVLPPLQRIWRFLALATSADNDSLFSRVPRIVLVVISYGGFYTQAIGLLLHAMDYFAVHHWYVLSITCAVVVLVISGVILTSYEWMWRWQSWIVPSQSQGRVVTVEDDDDDESFQAWSKKIGRVGAILLLWSFYCWLNVRLDYSVFWRYYSQANADYNVELMFVNCLQAGPILVGAAYTMYHIYPPFYTWHCPPTRNPTVSTANSVGEAHMESLLA